MVNDSEMTSRMEDHHAINHMMQLLQESDPRATCIYPPWVKRLLDPSRIRHSVMIPVNIDGEILFRSRRAGQFTKMLSGGGEEDLTLVQTHTTVVRAWKMSTILV
eukprot:4996959-Karenia_brevis.AAC.1